MITVAVAPIPVLLLFGRRQFAKIAIRIMMVFVCPLVVINHFVFVPNMVVAVVGVIDPVVMRMGASCNQSG